MSNDNSNNDPPVDLSRNRRSSITSAALSSLFQRSNSTSAGTGTGVFPGPITSAAMNDQQRRRLSISTLGLSGSSPATAAPFTSMRRASLSTNNSDSIDENAIDEEDIGAAARTAPTTPFTRRMSFGAQAMRSMRAPGSPGSSNDQGFNWSEQLRSRAESIAATGSRPSFSFASGINASPPRSLGGGGGQSGPGAHDRNKSISEMPAPPAQSTKPRPPPQKPDHFQERILKGDFYMD